MNIDTLNWQKGNGLMPAIVQHVDTGQVLMLGYMNIEALQQTLSSKKVTFYSRSRQCLWTKGETSGNYLHLQGISADYDQDSLLLTAYPKGPTCHTGSASCFKESAQWRNPLLNLENIIAEREKSNNRNSYSAMLLKKGINKVAQKVGEEACETVIAALTETDQRLCDESADLLYHLLLLLRTRSLSIADVFLVLQQRRLSS